MIVVGIFVLLGYYLNVEVNIPFVVALLTILGYSVNDTIVVFDRIREKMKRGEEGSFEALSDARRSRKPWADRLPIRLRLSLCF